MAYSSSQQQALKLYHDALEEQPKLRDFYHGKIPNLKHYKRMNIPEEEAIKIASYGYIVALRDLNVKLYFTQALLFGSAILGKYFNISVILPSQYGKSFVSACIAIELAYMGEPVSLNANDGELTKKIMDEIRILMPKVSEKVKKKMTTPVDQFEKMQTSFSKTGIGFIGGGSVQTKTLGGSYSDSLSRNKMMGQSGHSITDESALVPDSNYAETGRSEVSYRKDGLPYLSMEISNPHGINHFYRSMIKDPIPNGHLIIWADLRVTVEEGKHKYYEQDSNLPRLEDSKFFQHESTCLRYLVCDFGSLQDGSFFSTSPLIDNSPVDLSQGEYVLGLDSANRGSDKIMTALIRLPDEQCSKLRVVDLVNLKPNEWVDFETPQLIEDMVFTILEGVNVRAVVMDLGGGEYIFDRLGNRLSKTQLDERVALKGIYFNNTPTKERIREGFDLDDGSANGAELGVNKRAEMHIDLRDLMANGAITFTQKVADLVQPELQAVGKEIYGSRGRIQIEDKTRKVKHKLGHSPDALDAVLLGVHASLLLTLGLLEPELIF